MSEMCPQKLSKLSPLRRMKYSWKFQKYDSWLFLLAINLEFIIFMITHVVWKMSEMSKMSKIIKIKYYFFSFFFFFPVMLIILK